METLKLRGSRGNCACERERERRREMADVRRRRQQPKSARDAASVKWTHVDDSSDDKISRRHAEAPNAALLVATLVLFYLAVLGTVQYYYMWLPEPVAVDAPPEQFSEDRARIVLEKIMSFGYRPIGTHANEVLAPKYLLSEIEKIQSGARDDVSVEVEVQRPASAFSYHFPIHFQIVYANVTNIVVRVGSKAPNAVNVWDNALMISSHFDAAIGGAAASDDGVNIAIMIELLRFFVHQPPTHASLVFNFNGAEETLMQGSHGFITQQKWTKSIRAFINLEAAGAGGRELLFQAGSDELTLAYAQGAKYPHASIIGQEVFQTGALPAETDYRVYQDFGEISGMDFAYISNGYVYHTMLDDVSRIQAGAIQRLGENIIGIVDQLTNQPGRLEKVAATPHSSNTLFFDVAGQFMFSMAWATASKLCFGVVVLASGYLVSSSTTFQELVTAFRLVWQCIGAAFGASLASAVILTLYAPLSWYTQPVLGAAAFLTPALAGMVDRLATFLERSQAGVSVEGLWRVEKSLFNAMLLTWLVFLAIMLAFNLISSYIMAMWVLFPLAGQLVSSLLKRLKKWSITTHISISIAAVVFPAVHSGFVLSIAFVFFIPMMGRCGSQPPPDLVLGILFSLSLMVITSYTSRFFCFLSPKLLFAARNVLIGFSIVSVLISTTTNPYSDITPKRIFVQHVHRDVLLPNGTVATEDAGLWVNALDFRGLAPLKPFLESTQWNNTALIAPPKTLLDKFDLYGDLPWPLPVRDYLPERHSWYLPAKAPEFTPSETLPKLDVVSSVFDESTNRRKIDLVFSGPAIMFIVVDATRTRLTAWSIGDGIHRPVPHADGTYILQFTTGLPPASFRFWIEAESNASIDLGIVGHQLEKKTPEMLELVDALPSWIDAVQFVSTWTTLTI